MSMMSFCTAPHISATVPLIGVKFCMMVDMGLGQIFSPLGRRGSIPKESPKSIILAVYKPNISKTVSGSGRCQLELKISPPRAF